MRILSIELTDFMNVSHATLDFSSGMNILYGDNAEGKSTIFAAIYYVLTDNKRGDSWKDFVKSDKDFFNIKLKIQKSIHDPTVISFDYTGNKAKGSTLKKISYDTVTIEGADECKSQIEQWFDIQMIEAVIFSLQDSKPIGSLTPSERSTIFKKLFNSDFSDVVDTIVSKIKELEKNNLILKSRIEDLSQKTYPLQRLAEIDEVQLQSLKDERRTVELQIEAEKALIHEHELIKQKLNTRSATESLVSSLRDALSGLDREREAQILDLINQRDLLQESLDKEEQLFNELKKEEATLVAKKAAIGNPPREPDLSIYDSVNLETATLESKIKSYGTGVCPTCHQAYPPELVVDVPSLEARLVELRNQKATILVEKENYRKAREEYLNSVATVDEALSSLKKRIRAPDTSLLANFDSSLEKNKEIIRKVFSEKEKILQAKIIDNEKTLRDLSAIEEPKEYKTAVTPAFLLKLSEVATEISSIEVVKQQNVEIAIRNQGLLEQKAKDEASKESDTKDLHDNQTTIEKLTTVRKIYQTDFPAYLNSQACSKLETFMNRFLSTTKGGMEVSLQQTKKGTEFFYKTELSKEWLNAKMASGFESSALTIAFNSAVALAYKSSLLVLDEVDKSASDTSSLKVADTISSITGFDQIFMITHKKASVDLIKELPNTTIYHVVRGTFTKMYN